MRPAALFLLFAAACGTPEVTKAPEATPTWRQDVAPIAGENCVNCHNSDGAAAFLDLQDYDQAVAWSGLIQEKVEAREMPPFFAADTPECPNEWGFVHDARLSDEELHTFVRWLDGGTPEGDPATAAPITVPEVVTLPRVDQTLTPQRAWTTQPSSAIQDELVCFVLDPQLTDTRYLLGLEANIDNHGVAHHMLVYTADRAEAEAADAVDGAADGVFECFGGPGIDGPLLAGWVPSAAPTTYPSGSGWPVTADEVFVVQMHYHNLPDAQADQSALDLQWADSAPDKEIIVQLIGNARNAEQGLQPGPNDSGDPSFLIPAGVAGHTETSRHDLDIPEGVEVSIFMVTPHMHYVGTGLRAWIERADGTPGPCLVHAPTWDFDWQLFYYYDAAADNAPVVRAGDTLVIECTYDNTTDNPGVQRVMAEQGLSGPIDLTLGEGSTNEMCLLGVGAILR